MPSIFSRRRPMAERVGGQAAHIPLKDRLGPKVADLGRLDTRFCHRCPQARHIARNCPDPRADAPNAPPPVAVVAVRVDPLAGHRTDNAVCAGCSKRRHTIAQCWKEHPDLIPQAIRAKRKTANMAAHARKKMRVIISPDYQYKAMALIYKRPLTSNNQLVYYCNFH